MVVRMDLFSIVEPLGELKRLRILSDLKILTEGVGVFFGVLFYVLTETDIYFVGPSAK